MSKAPPRQPAPAKPRKTSVGSRSFARRQQLERKRVTRRRTLPTRSRRPSFDARALLRRVPTAAWICALVALLNATVWSIITPPFQGRDEVDHYAYVEQLAEKGTLPHAPEGVTAYSPGEGLVMEALHYGEVRFTSYTPSISTVAEQRTLERNNGLGAPLEGPESAGGTSSEPPLFYAIQTIPYAIGGGNVLVQLQLMRLLGALFGAITALLVFLFLREILPGVPWAATVGAICVALQPQFAATTGSLNPQALLFTLSAAAFLCLAYGFRRRLTIRIALLMGFAIAAGLVTYFSFIGTAVGALAALVVLAVRDLRARGRSALVAPSVAIGIGIAPVALDGLVKLLAGQPAFGQASGVGKTLSFSALFHEISYIWQMYLPRLPGMTHYFPGISTWREIWLHRSIGLYGWMDTTFPGWVDNVAIVVVLAVALLFGREVVMQRGALRARLPEFAGYALVVLGVLVMLGIASYASDAVRHAVAYGEPRYLLPLLPLLGAVVALAIRGAGRRWMPVAGAAMIALFLAHDLFSQLQTIARFYG